MSTPSIDEIETSFRRVTQEKTWHGNQPRWYVYMEVVIGSAEFKTQLMSLKPYKRLERVRMLKRYEAAIREQLGA